MKQRRNTAELYEIVYKILQTTVYFGVVGISIAYLIFLCIGQERHRLFEVEILLLFAVLLLRQADILARKKLSESEHAVKERNKKHTVAVCVVLVGGTISAVFYAIQSFCDLSGVPALAVSAVLLAAICTMAVALAFAYSIERKIKTEEQASEEKTSDAAGKEENT